ncbi:MAG: hypothetical protein H7099_01135 [Gemmatimonadaceae bacterium]|nr:hypothetical protein [Gemmatimonadaceae bacterium]
MKSSVDVSSPTLSRPPLFAGLPVAEFDVWEWRKAELAAFARSLGIPATGNKVALATRIRRQLAAHEVTAKTDVAHVPAAVIVSADIPAVASPTVEVRTPPVDAEPVRAFFSAAPGVSRSRALAEWYARRKAAARGANRPLQDT